jgi:hypothetical protein
MGSHYGYGRHMNRSHTLAVVEAAAAMAMGTEASTAKDAASSWMSSQFFQCCRCVTMAWQECEVTVSVIFNLIQRVVLKWFAKIVSPIHARSSSAAVEKSNVLAWRKCEVVELGHHLYTPVAIVYTTVLR